jgi:protein ImuB
VQGLACHADHRPELASRALPASPAATPAALPPRPLWLLNPPEALREVHGRPQRSGPLALAAGPERIESGWWDGGDVRRDYFIAIDSTGRWLWIFRDPRPPGGWFLHGIFS